MRAGSSVVVVAPRDRHSSSRHGEVRGGVENKEFPEGPGLEGERRS